MPELERSHKPYINICAIGHFQSGKTSLLMAITKVLSMRNQAKFLTHADVDSTPEEKSHGGTIHTRFFDYETDSRHYTHTDVSGHPDYTPNMIRGIAGMDGGILVVDATTGLMPQSYEHLELLGRFVYSPFVVVFLNKIEQVNDTELLEVVELEIAEALEGRGYPADTPIIRGSAQAVIQSTSSNISSPEYQQILKLMDVVDEWLPTIARETELPFLMPIRDVRKIEGGGLVVSGIVERGTVRQREQVDLVSFGDEVQTATIAHIEMFDRELPSAMPGDNVDIHLQNKIENDIKPGMVLAASGSIKSYQKFSAETYFYRSDEIGRSYSVSTGDRFQCHIRTAEVTGIVKLSAGIEKILPGDHVSLEVELVVPIPIQKGFHVVLRDGNITVGLGTVTVLPER